MSFFRWARPLPFISSRLETRKIYSPAEYRKKEGVAMNATRKSTHIAALLLLAGSLTAAGCAGGPLTTREKGAGIGALGGAAAGGLIGSAVGHPGAGAAIGGALGLGSGA